MRLHIAVWDPVPVYRQGIIAILGTLGHRLEEPSDLLAWAARKGRRAIMMTVVSADGWAVLERLGQLEERPTIVALLDETNVDMYIRAISAGATSAIARATDPDDIRQVLIEALRGRASLPTEVVTALAGRFGPTEAGRDRLSKRDLEWLRALSQGVTVAQLAKTVGYSEREMYRLLRDLYQRMNVANRTEAILRAGQGGWI